MRVQLLQGPMWAMSMPLRILWEASTGWPMGWPMPLFFRMCWNFVGRMRKRSWPAWPLPAAWAATGNPMRRFPMRLSKKIRPRIKIMGIPTYIKELEETDIPLIAKRALDEAHPDYPVPTLMTRDECEELVRRLLP